MGESSHALGAYLLATAVTIPLLPQKSPAGFDTTPPLHKRVLRNGLKGIEEVYSFLVSAPAFLADRMLGRTVRWLRVAGCDAEYCEIQGQKLAQDDVCEWAESEGRILLTRDRKVNQ